MKKKIIFAMSVLLSSSAIFSMEHPAVALAATTAAVIAAGVQLQQPVSAQLSSNHSLTPKQQQQALQQQLRKTHQDDYKNQCRQNSIHQPAHRGRAHQKRRK